VAAPSRPASHAPDDPSPAVARVARRRVSTTAGATPAGDDGVDLVAREEPLEIQLGGASLVVVMRTPGDDEELALGLLVTERVVRGAEEVASIRHCTEAATPEADGNVIRAVLREGVHVDLERLRRNLFASASCGICGKATIENLLAEGEHLDDPLRVSAAALLALPSRLRAGQAGFARTGGLHAAALFDEGGTLLALREDIGRHNAVDKVVGFAARRGSLPLHGHVLLVSGRISYEIAQKALAAGIALVAAVSAPSSLAVELAEATGMTLVGFLREGGFNVYGARERVVDGA
jgi:FdhD protein